jgi:hypothetical protein
MASARVLALRAAAGMILSHLEFILRFQTAAGLDRFIADLQKHRRSVWGEPGPPSPIGGLFA